MRQPVRYSVFAVISITVVVALILFLVFGEYARRQTAPGHIVPTAGVVKLYPRQTGILDELAVVEGAQVEVGQVLARVSNRREQTGESDTDAQLAQQLRTSVAQLESKIEDEIQLAELDANRLTQQIATTRADVARLRTQRTTETERFALAETRKNDFERLRKQGFVSESQYKDQYQAWLDAKLRREETDRSLASQEAQLADLLLQQQQLPGKRTSRLADLRNQLSELQQRLIEVASRREFAVVAPIAGKVTAIQAKPGQTLTPQLSLLTIIPADAEFEAELFLPTRAVGFVQPGQQVYLRYQAFPYQRYGLYEGKVKHVATAILAPQEIPAPVPVGSEPVYRVTITLTQQDVAAYGKRFPLQAGMLLDADIVLDRRPIWQWLLEPLLSLQGRI
ncbi:MAG: HlyD family secretion protein [Pseudomonadota bacterium]